MLLIIWCLDGLQPVQLGMKLWLGMLVRQERRIGMHRWAAATILCCRLLAKAHEWLTKAQTLAYMRAPLKRMRDLAHAGTRLPVNLPQVEVLKAGIRWREWHDAAAKVSP